MIFTINSPKYGIKEVQIDEEDWPLVSQYKWSLYKSEKSNTFYVVSNKTTNHNGIRLHRLIMNQTNPKIIIDHKNHNGLDNRKSNLRICTSRENSRNMKKIKTTESSKYKGVYYYKKNNRYSAYINSSSGRIRLGCFSYEDEAALAYNKKAIELFGEFAFLNDVPPISQKELERRKKEKALKESLIKRNYKCIYYWETRKKYQVQIKIKGKRKTIGYYTTEEQAIRAYNNYCDMNCIPERKIIVHGNQND